MVAVIQANNGTMTLDDLARYNVTIRKAIEGDFRGYKLYATGAPSSGAVTLAILKILEQYPSSDWKDTNLTTHRLAEAMRYAYAARMHLGDPTFIPSVSEIEKAMASDSTAREIRNHILDNTTQPVKNYDPDMFYVPESHGTSHVVTTDRSGMAVSLTTTINLLFGSRLMTPDSGIILNDEMNDFSIPGVSNAFGFPPSAVNFVRPGKRPLSSITPIMVETPSGELYLVTGAAGGSRIISSTALTVYRVLEGNATLREAVAGPRLHDQLMPDTSQVEWSFDNATVASMRAKGHNVTYVESAQSSVQGIRRRPGPPGVFEFEAVGETRQRNSGGLTV